MKYLKSLALLIAVLSGLSAIACEHPAKDSRRIAVAGGSLTEIIYFLGAEDRIVAVDTTSNYPEAATAFPSVGYVRNLSAEGLVSLSPTLILGEHDMGPPEVLALVERTGIETVKVPEAYTAVGILAKVRCIAATLQLEAAAKTLIAQQLAPKLDALVKLKTSSPRVALLLGVREGVPFAAGTNTSGDGILTMAGATNVFADFENWKPISMEAMAQANPEFIVLPQRGVDTAGGIAAIAEHPAIRLTAAGKNQRFIVMDGMTMLGFGPRTLDAALTLAEQLNATEKSGAL